jgi:hypothetical protein
MASKYRKKFNLPEDFYPLLEAYAREVLRDQPTDILEYSYLYFKALEEVSQLFIILVNRARLKLLITQRKEPTFLHQKQEDRLDQNQLK